MEGDPKHGQLAQQQVPPIIISNTQNQSHPKIPVFTQKFTPKSKRLTLTNYNGSISGTNSNDEDDIYDNSNSGTSEKNDAVFNGNEIKTYDNNDKTMVRTENDTSEDGKTVIENDQMPPQIYFISLLMDPSDENHDLLHRICDAILDDEEDQSDRSLAFSLVNFFMKIDLDVPFMKWCLEQDIQNIRPGSADTVLFRGSTFPMKIYSLYCNILMVPFLNEVAKEHIVKLSEIYSLDPDNYGSQASVSSPRVNRRAPKTHARLLSCEFSTGTEVNGNPYSTVTTNKRLSSFLLIVDDLLRNIIGSISKFPAEIRLLVRHVKKLLDAKFGESMSTIQRDQNMVNSLIFLRIICPCVALPDVFGLLDKESVMASSRKNFRLASALIQSLANGGHTAKSLGIEENALVMFIKRNQSKVNEFLSSFCMRDETMPPDVVRPFVLGMSPTFIPHKTLISFFNDIKGKMPTILPHLSGYSKTQEFMSILNMSPSQFSTSPTFMSPPPLPAVTPLGEFNLNGSNDLYQNRFSLESNSVISGMPTFENDVFTHLLAAQKSMSLYLNAHAKREEEFTRKLKEKDAEIEKLKKIIERLKNNNSSSKLGQLYDQFTGIDKEVVDTLSSSKEISIIINYYDNVAGDATEGKPDGKLSADLAQDEIYKMALFYKAKYSEAKRKNKEMKTCIQTLQLANEKKTEILKTAMVNEIVDGKKLQFEASGIILPCVNPNFVEKDVVTNTTPSGEKTSSPPGCDLQVSAHGRNLSSAAVKAPSDVDLSSVDSRDQNSPLKKSKSPEVMEEKKKQPQLQQVKRKKSHKKDKATKSK